MADDFSATVKGIDLTELSADELESGIPGIWPSWAERTYYPDMEATLRAHPQIYWPVINWLTVRADEPLIDEIVEQWMHHLIADGGPRELPAHGGWLLNGKLLNVVFETWIAQFTIIPKRLTGYVLGGELWEPNYRHEVAHGSPGDYSGRPMRVFRWAQSNAAFETALRLETGIMIYLETGDCYLQYQLAMPIEHGSRRSDPTVVDTFEATL